LASGTATLISNSMKPDLMPGSVVVQIVL